jgi:glycosyltransferase involved in cell wall biosynthesis
MSLQSLQWDHNWVMKNRQCSVHILSDSLDGGLGQAVLSEVSYLSSIGWRVTLSATAVPVAIQLDTGMKFTEVPVPTAIRDLTGMVHSAVTFRRKFRGSCPPSLIHAHGLRSFVITRFAFPLTPVVVTFHGAPPGRWIRRTFFRFAAKISAGAVSVAPINVPGWEHWWHWSPAIAVNEVEPQGDASRVEARAIEAESAKRLNATLTLGWLGRLDLPKRPDMWLNSLARARESGVDIRGVMVGDGPLFVQTRLEALNLNLDVEFLGRQTAGEAFRQMDVLLTWSDSEGVPFVMQEAIWAGIPCITNDLPGPTAFLGLGSLGVVDKDSVVGVLRILTDPKVRSELQLEQFNRLQVLLAEGRAEQKFASRYQHLALGGS